MYKSLQAVKYHENICLSSKINGTLSMMFTCCPNLMFVASPWLKIYRFSNWLFCWLWAVQSSKQFGIDPISFLFLTLDRLQLFYWVWVSYVGKNNLKPLRLIKNWEPDLAQVIFSDSTSGNQELISSVSK